jgi:hypothetical protein
MSDDVRRRAFDLEDDQPRNLAKSVTVEETFTFFDLFHYSDEPLAAQTG